MNSIMELALWKGTLALKHVDEDGNSVPLSEVYLHHWLLFNYLNSSGAIIGNHVVRQSWVSQIEYDVPSCASENIGTTECVHTQESVMEVPIGGDVVYGVVHQHIGAVGGAMYGQDGREICASTPLYGNGTEVGNEAGYLMLSGARIGASAKWRKPPIAFQLQ